VLNLGFERNLTPGLGNDQIKHRPSERESIRVALEAPIRRSTVKRRDSPSERKEKEKERTFEQNVLESHRASQHCLNLS